MVVGDFAIDLDTVVIGAGPGGYVAAIHAAELGQKVTVIEREFLGGVCLNVGCIPSKALIQVGHNYQTALNSSSMGIDAKQVRFDMTKAHEFKNKVVHQMTSGVGYLFKKHHIDVLWGDAFLKDDHSLRVIKDEKAQTYTFKHLIIATGSHPVEIPHFKFGGRILDSTGALDLTEVPNELVIIGGGYIGCELAGAYANYGAHVTILEGTPRIMSNYEPDLVKVAEKDFAAHNVDIVTGAMAKSANDCNDHVEVVYTKDHKDQTINADYVVVAVGRQPNTKDMGLEQAGIEVDDHGLVKVDAQGRTNRSDIFAIGDIVPGAALAHKASYEGKVAAEAIAGMKTTVDYHAMPAVCYVNTPIATTGLTAEEAAKQGLSIKTAQFPFMANGRAVSMDQSAGFVRMVYVDDENKQLVGAQIVGADAADLISEMTLAIECGCTVEDVALTIHPHLVCLKH